MVVPSSGLRHSYYCLVTWSAKKTSAFVTRGEKGMTSPDSPLLSEGLRLPVLGRSTEPKGSPACQWANLGHLHLWQRIRSAAAAERSLCSSVLQEERLTPAQHPGGGVTPRQLLFLAGGTLVSIPN